MLPFVLLLAVSIISQEGYEVAGFVLVAVLVIAVFFRHLPALWRALLFVGATLWHPFVALSIGIGHGSGFRETYRITAYSSVLYILGSFVPFVGPLVALVAALYVSVHGVKDAHETTMVPGHHLRLGPLIILIISLLAVLIAAFFVF